MLVVGISACTVALVLHVFSACLCGVLLGGTQGRGRRALVEAGGSRPE